MKALRGQRRRFNARCPKCKARGYKVPREMFWCRVCGWRKPGAK
jgi:hypothetical protein